jgi:hypothetical protein
MNLDPPQDRYSNFIYGFASKEELFILNSVTGTVVHLATGAFHISGLECLYGESGESLHRGIFWFVLMWQS